MPKDTVRPFLITKDAAGDFRLTIRDTHYNSQDYPIVKSYLQEETFKTAAAAKVFARDKFNAKTGEFFRREIQFPFFEYYLKGNGQAPPEAYMFETGTNV